MMLLVTSATTFLPMSMLCCVSRARMSSMVMFVIAAELGRRVGCKRDCFPQISAGAWAVVSQLSQNGYGK
eukprot:14943284-Heterocapsa_arctica.AAC.1